MTAFLDASAMNATSQVGGPVTVLPQIATGSPEQIALHVAQRLRQAEQFIQIIESLTSTTKQLASAWSGGASEAAVQKITTTVSAFMRIVKVIQSSATLLGISGDVVKSAQLGYNSVVGAVNPTVAALMSNPWTYGSAVALSTAASGSLRSYIGICQGVLQGLGSGNLMQQVMALMMITQEIEQLAGKGSNSNLSAVAGTVSSIAALGVSPAKPTQQGAAVGQDPPLLSSPNPFGGNGDGATANA